MTQKEDVSDTLARRAFLLTTLGAAIYALCVYFFVLRDNGAEHLPADTVQTP